MRVTKDTPRLPAELRRVSTLRALAAPVGDVALVLLAVAASITLHRWWVDVLAIITVARAQHALAIVMHDGAHHSLLAGRRANDVVGRWVGYPVGVSMDVYRRVHTAHHRAELSPSDPDLPLLAGYPAAWRLWRKVARDLTLQTTGRNVAYMLRGTSRNGSAATRAPAAPRARRAGSPRLPLLAGIAVAQLVVLGAFALAGHPWRYLELWLLPYVVLLPPILRVRAVMEHGGKVASPDRRETSRSVRRGLSPLGWLLAPHHVGFHVEHHVAPWVPHYRLPAVRRVLIAAGWLRERDVVRGYLPVWRELSAA